VVDNIQLEELHTHSHIAAGCLDTLKGEEQGIETVEEGQRNHTLAVAGMVYQSLAFHIQLLAGYFGVLLRDTHSRTAYSCSHKRPNAFSHTPQSMALSIQII
jgi:hypothetical protein